MKAMELKVKHRRIECGVKSITQKTIKEQCLKKYSGGVAFRRQ
jgi:hypothetical protein